MLGIFLLKGKVRQSMKTLCFKVLKNNNSVHTLHTARLMYGSPEIQN